MSFQITTDTFEIQADWSISSFHKRSTLVTALVTSAVEMALQYCESLSEKDLGAEHIDWKDEDEIISAFLDTQMFTKWAEMVAFDLSGE